MKNTSANSRPNELALLTQNKNKSSLASLPTELALLAQNIDTPTTNITDINAILSTSPGQTKHRTMRQLHPLRIPPLLPLTNFHLLHHLQKPQPTQLAPSSPNPQEHSHSLLVQITLFFLSPTEGHWVFGCIWLPLAICWNKEFRNNE